MTRAPSKLLRIVCAARSPASEAPTMTMGSGKRQSSTRIDLLFPAQDVVVAEIEDVVGHVDALAVALAQVHVNDDAGHRALLSSTMRSASSSGMASATCSVC